MSEDLSFSSKWTGILLFAVTGIFLFFFVIGLIASRKQTKEEKNLMLREIEPQTLVR